MLSQSEDNFVEIQSSSSQSQANFIKIRDMSSPQNSQFSRRHKGNQGYYNGDEVVFCKCNEACRIVTSWTEINPSRRFHSCQRYGTKGACDFFLWYDPPLAKRTNNVMAGLLKNLRRIEDENKKIKVEICKAKAKERMLWMALICTWILLVAILLTYASGYASSKKQSVLEFEMLQ